MRQWMVLGSWIAGCAEPGKPEVLTIGSGDEINMGAVAGDPSVMCIFTADHRLEMDGLVLERVEAKGYNPASAAAIPSAGGLRVTRTTSTCVGDTQWLTATGPSSESDYDWAAAADDTGGTGDSLTECADTVCPGTTGCSGEYTVEIVPGESVESCAEFQYVFLKFFGSEVTTTSYRPPAECDAGSARMQLVPIRIGDQDEDGSYHVTYRPVHVTGSGAFTSQAVITSTTVVAGPASGLKAIRPGNTFRFTAADALDLPSNQYVSLSGTQSHVASALGGSTVFVAEEVTEGDLWDHQLDVTWTCGSGGTSTPAAQGYKLALDQIGCGVKQTLTLRPRLATAPKRIEWELYGQPDQPYVTPVQTVPGGHAFAVDIGRLSLDATLLSTTSQAATVRIDSLTWSGDSICTPGTYTLPVE